MKLSPRELDHLTLSSVGLLAQRRLARGLCLNAPEATALVALVVMERARDGDATVAALMSLGKTLLGRRQVMDGVPEMLHEVQVEATFRDGTKLVTVHMPVCRVDGDLATALYGSFLPVPERTAFPELPEASETPQAPGTLLPALGAPPLQLNDGRETAELTVTNKGDRAVQVGSHYHFIETNAKLEFDRIASLGKRLSIPAGTSVRFEPGDTKQVVLCQIAGDQVIRGGNNLVNGRLVEVDTATLKAKIADQGFYDLPETSIRLNVPSPTISRRRFAHMFGPTTGDKVLLGDTGLVLEVEADLIAAAAGGYGDECTFGGGKVIRDGMGQLGSVPTSPVLERVITNALIVDYTGIVRADIGIRGGLIAGIGKAGNPDVMSGVTSNMAIGPGTDVIAGEGLIVTAGGIDTHIHFICPQQCDDALASGVTTMYGGGQGPSTGSKASTCTTGPSAISSMLRATDGIPINFGFSGKGNSSSPAGLEEQIEAGAAGLKLHEDWGTAPASIDCCLTVGDKYDVAITIHTDTLNESSFVEGSIAAFKGRTIHTYHSEGAGGGHAPDIMKVCGEPNVIPSSTNPTRPYTVNTIDEHLDMLMVCHHLSPDIPEDIAFADSRIRAETIAAEDILHDTGAISIISSDSQAMGRVGEVITRTWQTAAKMKAQRGPLSEDKPSENDNYRIKRYVSKYTINPALAHGMSDVIGSVEQGKLADLVLWHPSYFGSKPEIILKGGDIVQAQMGDPNASIPTPQPVISRPQFGAIGKGISEKTCLVFVSKASLDNGTTASYGLSKRLYSVRNCRSVSKASMKFNSTLPKLEIDPETFETRADGELLTCEPASEVALAQRFFLF